MIIGDPYKFAIFIDTVENWNNSNDFCNGTIFFSINEIIFPNEIISVTLKSELNPIIERLIHIETNNRLFELPPQEALEAMYTIAFPTETSIKNDYRFLITPTSWIDNNYFVFAVSNGTSIRLLATQLIYNMEICKIYEVNIPKEEIADIIFKLKNFYHSM